MNELSYSIPFKLFSDCVPVRGYARSTIIDLGRESYFLIPNDLYDILTTYEGKTIADVLEAFDKKDSDTIVEYFNFLSANELLFFTTEPDRFPKIDFSAYKHPFPVYQAILDIGQGENYINRDIFESLNTLNCEFLEIRIFKKISVSELEDILIHTNDTTLLGINLYLHHPGQDELESFTELFNSYLRINNVSFYNSLSQYKVRSNPKRLQNISFTSHAINSCKDCGIVSKEQFSINIKSFSKSVNCNSCLYGKISVDENGEIKNCPSMKENFGNIKNSSLEEASKHTDFKKKWYIKKDDVSGCRDCEFRYICVDCRAYIEAPNDEFSKPLKCGYNPFTAEWQEWSTNPLKQQAIEFYSISYD